MTTPQSAAEQIVVGLEKGSYRVVIGKDARMLDLLTRLMPQRATDLVAKKMQDLLG
jgi:short-subunit dehydrogenase